MWVVAAYQPTALFSLKASTATSSGGKSVLVPTPYAIKMALLDGAFRLWGAAQAERRWPTIRDRSVALLPPKRLVVTNLFQKVLRPRRRPATEGSRHAGPLQQTIAFREYIYYDGQLEIGLDVPAGDEWGWLTELLLQVNYLGKRGCFVQLVRPPQLLDELPRGFVPLSATPSGHFDIRQFLQQLDDCTPALSFDKANVYSPQRVTLGRERILRHVFLPYQITQASKSFTLYERLDL